MGKIHNTKMHLGLLLNDKIILFIDYPAYYWNNFII